MILTSISRLIIMKKNRIVLLQYDVQAFAFMTQKYFYLRDQIGDIANAHIITLLALGKNVISCKVIQHCFNTIKCMYKNLLKFPNYSINFYKYLYILQYIAFIFPNYNYGKTLNIF